MTNMATDKIVEALRNNGFIVHVYSDGIEIANVDFYIPTYGLTLEDFCDDINDVRSLSFEEYIAFEQDSFISYDDDKLGYYDDDFGSDFDDDKELMYIFYLAWREMLSDIFDIVCALQ